LLGVFTQVLPLLLFAVVLAAVLHGCGPRSDEAKQQELADKIRASDQSRDDKKRAEVAAKAKRLDEAALSTAVAPDSLVSDDALSEYSAKLSKLLSLISDAEKHPLTQSPYSQWRPHIEQSLTRAKEALASGMITKGKAQLRMKDFTGARNTLRQVVLVFDPKTYGPYTRQAEHLLQDVETAEAAVRH
jgi:hypothetical protein